MDMNTEEVLANLEGYALWEYKDYKINKDEYNRIVADLHELQERRNHEHEKDNR